VAHNHHHVRNFNFYDLMNPTTRTDVAPGLKQAFCLEDLEQQDPNAPPGKFSCGNQGITWGWADIYTSTLPCQYVNVTGIADGSYVLTARTNASKVVAEANEYNNGTSIHLSLSGNTVTTQAAGFQSSIEVVPASNAGAALGSAISWGTNRYDFFYREPSSGRLYHKYQDATTGAWNPSGIGEPVGPVIVGAPSATSWDTNRLDVFARTADNKMSHVWWDNGWGSEVFSVTVLAAPVGLAPSKNRLIASYKTAGNAVGYLWWNGSNWFNSSQVGMGFDPLESPALAASGAETVHTITRDPSGVPYWTMLVGGNFAQFPTSLGGILNAPASAASWNVNRLDVVGRGTDNALYRNVWLGGTSWTGWFPDGVSNLANAPVIISTAPDRLDVFYYQIVNGTTFYRDRRWDGSQWVLNQPSAFTGINPNINLYVSSFADPQYGLFHTISDGSVRMRQFW
jgi:hypothetical protein